ncbi:uncharacterized protein LY79DRAFT_584725 [Colletotrichum navitas]|uniref:Uncharacterized protein n=1 Tax=Colletotrichum navitas TaxID=681940 RepID=A0AAD8PKN8_9PEZI|nr:uncharacterized protein LY79DRAFT_584725 [Colletotrichum navitas]KAK1569435.1 hypothetical protein LY79DRAFT_584725 [Colletotrichum navitas]
MSTFLKNSKPRVNKKLLKVVKRGSVGIEGKKNPKGSLRPRTLPYKALSKKVLKLSKVRKLKEDNKAIGVFFNYFFTFTSVFLRDIILLYKEGYKYKVNYTIINNIAKTIPIARPKINKAIYRLSSYSAKKTVSSFYISSKILYNFIRIGLVVKANKVILVKKLYSRLLYIFSIARIFKNNLVKISYTKNTKALSISIIYTKA